MSGVKTGRLPRSTFDRPMRESKRKPDFVPYESKPSVKVFNGQSNEDRYVQPKISDKDNANA